MAEFYSARSETITPLPWQTFAPPFPPTIVFVVLALIYVLMRYRIVSFDHRE